MGSPLEASISANCGNAVITPLPLVCRKLPVVAPSGVTRTYSVLLAAANAARAVSYASPLVSV